MLTNRQLVLALVGLVGFVGASIAIWDKIDPTYRPYVVSALVGAALLACILAINNLMGRFGS